MTRRKAQGQRPIEPCYLAFGQWVAARRALAGMDLAEVAPLAGMCASTLSKIENGKARVLYHHVEALRGVLGDAALAERERAREDALIAEAARIVARRRGEAL